MQPVNERVLRRRRRRRKLFLWRTAVCLCVLFLLLAAAKGATAVIKDLSPSASAKPASSAEQPGSSRPEQPSSASARPASSRMQPASSQVRSSSPASREEESSPASLPAASAPQGWFSDALLIGDSRTEGLRNYDGLPDATYYAVKGLMVNTVYTRKEVAENGAKLTVMQAQAKHSFGKIYVMLGINELGWSSQQSFISDYEKMVDDLKKDHPKAKIYLQALFPVSAQKSAESSIYKNDKITAYNRAIQDIAKKKNVVFLNTARAVSKDGVLPEGASADGVHLNSGYCKIWCDYLKANAK